jgi:hypothetical protein
MDREELCVRVRQEFDKRKDGVLYKLGGRFTSQRRNSPVAVRPKFFFDSTSIGTILGLIRQRIPGCSEQIVQEAEKICSHRFDLLGYRDLDFGSVIDWHLDPVHGKQASRKPFYKVRYLNFDEVGDSKIPWELNRHQHFVTLAKAYRITGNRGFADEIFQQWRHWQGENPYPIGINWASSLEVAFRSLSWLWTLQLLDGASGLPDNRKEWLPVLALHGRHIERYLSTYFSPNTHLLGEGVGLFFLGLLCPEIDGAESWKKLGWEIIVRESERQVQADGFHFEQSTYYHVYASDFFLHSLILAKANGIPVPPSLGISLEKMLQALCLLSRYGHPPRSGDDDGGRLFDPRRNHSEHMLDPLATGAILFGRCDFKYVAGDLREETLWLLGSEGVHRWDELEGTKPDANSTALENAGLYLLTSEKPSAQLVLDAGPLGVQSGGHGHADALSVCLQSGASLLIDPGTYEYVEPGGDRELFRGTAMHNTVQIDGVSQAEMTGPFSWKRLTAAKVEQWISTPVFDLQVASHDGYERLPQPAKHRRWVFSLKNGIYLVRDLVEGQGRHRLDISWHLGQDVQLVEENVFRVKGASLGMALLPARGHGWSEGMQRSQWSPVYGRKAPMSVVNFGITTDLPAEFTTLLAVLDEVHPSARTFERIGEQEAESRVRAYRYETDGVAHTFLFAKAAQAWHQDLISSDAEVVCWSSNKSGSDQLLILCNGSYTQIQDGLELRCSRAVQWCELQLNHGERTLRCSDPEAVEVMLNQN